MDTSNRATPLVGAMVADPRRVAAVGLVLSLMVMLSATFISCPAELRNETITGNVSLTRAYGKRSTLSDNPAVVPGVVPLGAAVTAWPVWSVRTCPADGPGELQAFANSEAAPSATMSFNRFTENPP